MGLRDRIRDKNKSLRKRQDVPLPELGEVVTIQSLNLVEQWRFSDKTGFARVATMIALSVIDPETGAHLYAPDSMEDHNEIGEFSGTDSAALTDAILKINGMTEEAREEVGKASPMIASSSSSSQPATVYLPESLPDS